MNDNIIPFPNTSQSGRSGGGGEGGQYLEARVAKMEAGMEHIERDVGELRTDMRDVRDRLSRLEERVSHLPSKGFIVTGFLLTLTVMIAWMTFQQKIQTVIGAVPATQATSP